MAYDTVAGIISDAAKELGLVKAAIADPIASTDASIVQLLAFLKSQGREIAKRRQWKFQQIEYTFPTVNGQVLYTLPADFRTMIDQSGWNRTTRFPLGGPESAQQWQYLKALPSPSSLVVIFRPRDGKIELFRAPGATVNTIAFEYISSYWVALTGTVTPAKDAPTLATDVVLFDPLLMVRAVKLAWKKEKGLDYTSAQVDYEASLDDAMSDDESAPVLRIDGQQRLLSGRVIDDINVPYTGFGQ